MLKSVLLCGAAVALVVAAGSASAREQFTSFDPSGSISTAVTGINGAGTVAGYYYDSTDVTHGFLRTSDGTITSFDPKGSESTVATGINDKGEIAGWYRDSTGTYYSFVRTADGKIRTFNPTSGSEPGLIGVNEKGKVAGWYTTSDYEEAGFVGAPEGKMKQLTVEGMAINAKGAVTGVDGASGFVRWPSGKMVTFTGAGDPSRTIPTGINASGEVAGYGDTVCGQVAHGFSRDSTGSITTIDPPNSEATVVSGINDKGVMTGHYYYDGYHGFVRNAGGSYTSFDVSGATYGTYPEGISSKGAVAGNYYDSSGVAHGFVGTP